VLVIDQTPFFGVLRMYSLVIKVLAVLFASLCSFSYSILRGLELHCHDLGFVRLAVTALFLIYLVNEIESKDASKCFVTVSWNVLLAFRVII
jgi:hypothetical protein